jgi:hypothetical protein
MKHNINHLIQKLIENRYTRFSDKSIIQVYNLDNDFITAEDDIINAYTLYREQIYQSLSDKNTIRRLINLFVRSTKLFIYNNNQFIRIDDRTEKGLYTLYNEYINQIQSILSKPSTNTQIKHNMENLLRNHFLNHKAFISNMLSIYGKTILTSKVCSEYSPEFQLGLLGIDMSRLRGPILDIGCGVNGNLVRYITDRGFDGVYGIDRLVKDSPYLIEEDWFDYPLEENTWGTIISHMSFSNHFINNHYDLNGNPEKYMLRFMEILKSLRIGGSFYYTPGLPFIEEYLPASKYKINRRPITMLDLGNLNINYTTEIRKISI